MPHKATQPRTHTRMPRRQFPYGQAVNSSNHPGASYACVAVSARERFEEPERYNIKIHKHKGENTSHTIEPDDSDDGGKFHTRNSEQL